MAVDDTLPDYGLHMEVSRAGRLVRVTVIVTLDGFAYGDGTHVREASEEPDDYEGDLRAAGCAALGRCLSALGERLSRDPWR